MNGLLIFCLFYIYYVSVVCKRSTGDKCEMYEQMQKSQTEEIMRIPHYSKPKQRDRRDHVRGDQRKPKHQIRVDPRYPQSKILV